MAASAAPMMQNPAGYGGPMTSVQDEDVEYLPLSSLRGQLSEYDGGKADERKEADEARRLYHGDQWTAEEVAVHRSRGQPTITYNLVAKKVNGIVGLVERLRQDPKAFPRTPKHQAGADVATAVLNDVLDTNQWKALSPAVARDGAIEPVAGIELSLEEGDHGDMDIALHYLEPDTVFYDPRSSREDFTDARFMGINKWVSLDDAIGMFPDSEVELRDAATNGGAFDRMSNSDRLRKVGWTNGNSKHIRLVEHWYRKRGQWLYQFYTGDLGLARGVSPFTDEKGRTFCRFILFSANVDHDNDRYGFIRNFKGAQDEVNYRRSAATWALFAKQVKVAEGSVPDIEKLRAEVHRFDGVMETPPGGEFEVIDNTKAFAGNLEMLQEAKSAIEGFGPNEALVGNASGSSSGRAIQLLQQAGISELGPYILGYRDWKMRVYRAVWNAVRVHWKAERYIRVTDDDGLAQFFQINKLEIEPTTGQPVIDNAVGSMDVDIIIDEGPDHVTLMEDTLEALMQIAPNLPPQAQANLPKTIIRLASLPQQVKDQILADMEQAAQPQPPDPVQQQAVQLEMAGAAAKVDEDAGQGTELRADAGVQQAKVPASTEDAIANARLKHAKAQETEAETALRFMAPEPLPYGPAEVPYANGLPTLLGLPPQPPAY